MLPWLTVQAIFGPPPSKRMRAEGDAAVEGGPDEEELPQKEAAMGKNGTADAGPVNRVPISDLETLQELRSISGGCCICNPQVDFNMHCSRCLTLFLKALSDIHCIGSQHKEENSPG